MSKKDEDKPGKRSAIFKPLYIEKTYRQRVLAGFYGSLIMTEYENQWEVFTANDIIKLLYSENLLLFVRKHTDLPELDHFIEASKTVYCDKEGHIRAFKFEGAKRKTHWIVEIGCWDYISPVTEHLKELRATFEHAGVGTQNSPGGMGQALMRKSLKDQYGNDWYHHRHRRPSHPFVAILRDHSFGARQDAIDTRFFEVAWELDEKNAYSFHFRKLPTGICSRTFGDECFDHLTCFVPVSIIIKNPLKIGIFPVREEDKSISYPTEEGTYQTWLWREHIDFIQERGLSVEVVGAGIAWDEFTCDMEAWSLLMEHLRDTAPSERTSYHMKLATVAGIGRENLPDVSHIVISNGEWGVDKPLLSDGVSWEWYIHEQMEERPNNLPHWFYYCVAMNALSLTRMAVRYEDYLIGTATDAIYVREDAPGLEEFPDKNTPDLPSGTWRKMKHTNMQRLKLGRFKSDQKTVMTGVRKEDREKVEREERTG